MADGMERRSPAEDDGEGAGDEGGAEQAFEALRAEVAALRRGVELVFRQVQQGAAGQPGAELPDYSPTLGVMAQELHAVGARLAAIERAPALASSAVEQADGLRRALHGVGEDARRGLAHSQGRLDDAVQELRGMVRGAHEWREQKRWLRAVGAVGAMGGMLLWLLATAVLPWGVGTGLAGLAYGGRWNAGQAMLGDASPETRDRMVRLYKACPKDSTTELCEAVLAVRTIASDAPAPPGVAHPAPDGAKGPAFGTVPGAARGRVGR
jgi:hypothetical protein